MVMESERRKWIYLGIFFTTTITIVFGGRFRKNLNFDGKACPYEDQLQRQSVSSVASCLSICSSEYTCACVFYNKASDMCYVCKRRYWSEENLVNALGFIHYQLGTFLLIDVL